MRHPGIAKLRSGMDRVPDKAAEVSGRSRSIEAVVVIEHSYEHENGRGKLTSLPEKEPKCNWQFCLMQDEPGSGGSFLIQDEPGDTIRFLKEAPGEDRRHRFPQGCRRDHE